MLLTKHHALGNDFLVLIDLDDETSIDAGFARGVCDRRTGVGADGLMKVTRTARPGTPFEMLLLNSDGSPAEMSGNGMRCLVQALVVAGVAPGPEFVVATAGGDREVSHRPGNRPGESWVSVDMGPVTFHPEALEGLEHREIPQRVAVARIGNPHLVVSSGDPDAVDLADLGPFYETQIDGGANVEWIARVNDERLRLRVWERGAGITQACGTGACASAAVAAEWGLVDAASPIVVEMPGGSVDVTLGESVTLAGTASFVAGIDVDPAHVDAS